MNRNLITDHPPANHDLRPERSDREQKLLERLAHDGMGWFKALYPRRRKLAGVASRIEALGTEFSSLSDRQLSEEAISISRQLHRDSFTPPLIVRSFALIRETAGRTLGMRHYRSQLIGGQVLLQGAVAEMETGEGKTLTATLAAATVALAGIPVHVISVNDYLTSRDAEEMGVLYRALGLSVGCVVHGMTTQQRREAYDCQITYVTNKEIVFDYLRDRLTLGARIDPLRLQAEYLHGRGERVNKLMLRGLHFALVDEADSILIDEARTPLIISGSSGGEEEQEFLRQALEIADSLREKVDYQLEPARRQVHLTEKGRKRIGLQTAALGSLWSGLVWREGMVSQALSARHFFHRDEQYLVRDGKVEIIDEFTGRVMADRSWEQGLHQLIEVIEGVELTQRRETLAKVSYQKFFRRYLRLAGMTGTAREVAGEIWSVYNLLTLRIPTNRPVIRKRLSGKILPTLDTKWQAVVERVEQLHNQGRPVLIGTRSVAASEHLRQLVSTAGLAHQVLNARQNSDEAEIISCAGGAGNITIATNMAGRGTDIKLGPGVREVGGLHVIITERHEAARIDRQLAGRCGRQGDPGSYEEILSRQDPLLSNGHGSPIADLSKFLFRGKLSRLTMRHAQKKMETYHSKVRKELFLQDQQQGSLLSFSGRME